MKKVLILASVASMIDQFNMRNIAILRELGYEVHVAANFKHGNTTSQQRIHEFKSELEEQSIAYYQIDFSRNVAHIRRNCKAYQQLVQLMSHNSYHFIHCHSPIGGVCGRLVAHKTNTRVIYTAHGFHFFKKAPLINWLLFYPAERYLAKYTDVLVTINQEDYQAAQKFKSRKTVYLPGIGIDSSKYNNEKTDSQHIREQLGIPENKIILLSVGELSKRKNHEVVIKALYKLRNQDVIYLICGQGSLESYLKNMAKEADVDVRLLGYRTDIPEIFAASDVFVFPSLQEGLPVALMEAMAAGLPVICSEIRGNNDLIEDNIGGYIINNGDVDGYVRAIESLANHPEIRGRMKEVNQIKIMDFDRNVTDRIMRDIYRELQNN